MLFAYYDLHIHSALSPCADDDMTPCDIIGMAVLGGLDVIAVTDHNTFENAKAACKAAQPVCAALGRDSTLIVLPGAEVTTAEEVHVLCLFDAVDTADAFEAELSAYYTNLKNREDVFGKQIICNSDDSVLGTMERMLMAPTTITFEKLYALTMKHGGAFVPAHVDRTSFSVTSNLGFLPPGLDIAAVEFSAGYADNGSCEYDLSMYSQMKHIFSSDAHQLHGISEKRHYIELPELTAKAVTEYLRTR